MTIKLTHNQLEGLQLLVQSILNITDPENMAESLLFELMHKINDRMIAKLKRKMFDNRTGSNLRLNSIESKAFYCWYNQIGALVKEDQYTYERNVATNVINQIDKVYA